MIMIRTLSLVLLASVAMTALPAMAEEMTIEEAVSVGTSTHPRYNVVASNERATEEELKQAKGLFLPSVDAYGNAGFARYNNVTSRAKNEDGKTFHPTLAGVTLTQMLFDGFYAKNEVERQYARVDSAANRVRETVEFVGLDVSQSYLEVLRQRELLAIAQQNVDEHNNMLSQIQTAEQAGRITAGDTSQAQARLSAAQAELANVMQALRNAEATYIEATGLKPDILVMPANPAAAVGANVDEAVDTAVMEGPTLKIYESDIEVAQKEYDQSGNNFYPQVDLQLNAQTGNDNAGAGHADEMSAQVVANWNMYRGGIDTALRRELIYRHAQTKESRAEQARAIETDVRQTWAAMVAAGERAQAFASQSAANEQVFRAYKDQFDLNRRTLLDVLDSQNELFVAKSNAINAQYLQMLAGYRLLALQGKLLPAMGVAAPREAVVASK